MKRCMIAVMVIASLCAAVKTAHAQAAPSPGVVLIPTPEPVPARGAESPPGKTLRNAGIAMFVVGIGSFTASIVTMVLAVGYAAGEQNDAADSLGAAAIAALCVSTLTAPGIAMWSMGQNKMNRSNVSIVPVLSPNRAGLSLGWRF